MTDERATLPPVAETHIPGPARVPSEFSNTIPTDPLTALADRVGALSDELNDPDGLLHRLFADLDRKGERRELRAQRRHQKMIKAVTHVANGVAALSAQVAKLTPQVEENSAQLRLVYPPRPAE